ncbi:MAG: hypothetical protein ACI9DO_001447 [Reinekea sp.]|jgi:hypothetical protein
MNLLCLQSKKPIEGKESFNRVVVGLGLSQSILNLSVQLEG